MHRKLPLNILLACVIWGMDCGQGAARGDEAIDGNWLVVSYVSHGMPVPFKDGLIYSFQDGSLALVNARWSAPHNQRATYQLEQQDEKHIVTLNHTRRDTAWWQRGEYEVKDDALTLTLLQQGAGAWSGSHALGSKLTPPTRIVFTRCPPFGPLAAADLDGLWELVSDESSGPDAGDERVALEMDLGRQYRFSEGCIAVVSPKTGYWNGSRYQFDAERRSIEICHPQAQFRLESGAYELEGDTLRLITAEYATPGADEPPAVLARNWRVFRRVSEASDQLNRE